MVDDTTIESSLLPLRSNSVPFATVAEVTSWACTIGLSSLIFELIMTLVFGLSDSTSNESKSSSNESKSPKSPKLPRASSTLSLLYSLPDLMSSIASFKSLPRILSNSLFAEDEISFALSLAIFKELASSSFASDNCRPISTVFGINSAITS